MAVFATLPDNPTVRSIFQRTGEEEDLGREREGVLNSRAGKLIHHFHSPHQPAWLQTQSLRPYSGILVARHYLFKWAFVTWYSLALSLSLFSLSLAEAACFSLYPSFASLRFIPGLFPAPSCVAPDFHFCGHRRVAPEIVLRNWETSNHLSRRTGGNVVSLGQKWEKSCECFNLCECAIPAKRRMWYYNKR